MQYYRRCVIFGLVKIMSITMKKSLTLTALAAAVALAGCQPNTEEHAPTQFIALGDSGYHHDYLDPEDLGFNSEELLKMEREDWVEKGKPIESFKIFPTHQLHGADSVIEQSGQQSVANAIEAYCATATCEFMALLGDNIYPDGADGSADDVERFRKILHLPYVNIEAHNPNFQIYAALGNHDWDTSFEGRTAQVNYGETDERYQLWEPGYYSFRRGDAEFFVLDTNMLLAGTTVYKDELDANGIPIDTGELDRKEPYEHPVNGEDEKQLQWLEQSLKGSDARWKVVYGHHTLWSSGGSKFEEARALRKLIMPMLCTHADLYMAGHEHDLGIHQDSCEETLGHAQSPLNLLISGAGSKQRSIHERFQEHQVATNPTYKNIYNEGMIWGFAHVSLDSDMGTIEMVTTPNDKSGKPIVSYRFEFPNRTSAAK